MWALRSRMSANNVAETLTGDMRTIPDGWVQGCMLPWCWLLGPAGALLARGGRGDRLVLKHVIPVCSCMFPPCSGPHQGGHVVCAGLSPSIRSSFSLLAGSALFVIAAAERLVLSPEDRYPCNQLRESTLGPLSTRRTAIPAAAEAPATPCQPTPLGPRQPSDCLLGTVQSRPSVAALPAFAFHVVEG